MSDSGLYSIYSSELINRQENEAPETRRVFLTIQAIQTWCQGLEITVLSVNLAEVQIDRADDKSFRNDLVGVKWEVCRVGGVKDSIYH